MSELASLVEQLLAIDEAGFALESGDEIRRRLFDTLAATALGFATPDATPLASLEVLLSGQSPAALAFRDKCRLLVAVTRATEIDDIDIRSCTTVGAVVVPVALAVAAAQGLADNRNRSIRALAGIAAGYEAMTRLGRTIGGATAIYRGIWPTLATAAFASAAVAGVVLRLAPDRLVHALGISLQQTIYPSRPALAGQAYRPFALGEAAVSGWIAALAAAAGVVSESTALETFLGRIESLTGHGDFAVSQLSGEANGRAIADVDSKPFPTSRQALASVQALRSLLPLSLDSIEVVEVAVPSVYRDMVDQPTMPATRIGSMIGVQYAMALAATEPESLYDVVRTNLPHNELIARWMRVISVVGDAELSQAFPGSWGSRVEVRLKSGERLVADERKPAGCALQPFGWQDLEQKYRKVSSASGFAAADRMDQLLTACRYFGTEGSDVTPAALLSLPETMGNRVPGSQPQVPGP